MAKASAIPTASITAVSRTNSHVVDDDEAPSAIRMPISRVRRVTTNDITP
jgi:hypothetical protein